MLELTGERRLSLAEGMLQWQREVLYSRPTSPILQISDSGSSHSSMVADTRLRVIVGRQSATVHTQGRAPIKGLVACQHGRWILAQRQKTEWCTPLHLDVQDISVLPQALPRLAKEVGLQAMLTTET